MIISTIGAVTTKTGLTARAVLDHNAHPTGTTVSSQRMKDIEKRYLTRGEWHGEWNYTLHARPLRDPEPEPEPACASALAGPRELNQPALTGMQPAHLTALAAALQVPFAASREQRNCKARGGRRVNAVRNGGAPHGNRKLDVTGHVLATRLRDHLHLTLNAIGTLLGVDASTVSHATSLTRQLLADNAIPLPPAAQPPAAHIRTLAGLREYTARHGMETLSRKLPAGTSP